MRFTSFRGGRYEIDITPICSSLAPRLRQRVVLRLTRSPLAQLLGNQLSVTYSTHGRGCPCQINLSGPISIGFFHVQIHHLNRGIPVKVDMRGESSQHVADIDFAFSKDRIPLWWLDFRVKNVKGVLPSPFYSLKWPLPQRQSKEIAARWWARGGGGGGSGMGSLPTHWTTLHTMDCCILKRGPSQRKTKDKGAVKDLTCISSGLFYSQQLLFDSYYIPSFCISKGCNNMHLA